ncbi:MAG: ABC transporter permease subunit, partial [Candidatus Eremiobacteraeota bacterium]|nr:ABC transporter permease subunit [Candidatus Eremiobacteraeota bacterium]
QLKMRSIPAEHRAQLGGTRVLWEALLAGSIDAYPEYTGTLTQEILHQPQMEVQELRKTLANQGVGMTPSLGFNNTYALGMRAERARQLGLTKMSQLKHHPELRFGFGHEFLRRQDGWPRIQSVYSLPQKQVAGTDHDLAYEALVSGQLDVMEVYTTDAEIEHYGLVLLEDDLSAFPRYDAVVLYRLEKQALLQTPLEELAGRLDRQGMARLNQQVRLQQRSEAQVAAAWLGLDQPESPGLGTRLWRSTGEHLRLVGISLAIACLIGLPLGMLCHARAGVARPVLGFVGLVQTIPSLALLVFLLPWSGLGPRTAILALSLYALFPIVQGTYHGLQTIPGALRESAEALGLSAQSRWLRVDLPLALPAIVHGLQTAAVIAVGTATLAALIGAGGYGEPILTGVRLARTDLLLEGAVPSAVMALLVQWAFGRWQQSLRRA